MSDRPSFAAFDSRLTPFIASPDRRPASSVHHGLIYAQRACAENDNPAHYRHDDLTLRRNDTWVVGRP